MSRCAGEECKARNCRDEFSSNHRSILFGIGTAHRLTVRFDLLAVFFPADMGVRAAFAV